MKAAVNIRIGVAGYYRIAKGKVGQPATVVAEFKNLVTNQGLDNIGDVVASGSFSTKEMFPKCYVGTGNTTPAFTDTQLTALLAGNNSAGSNTVTFVDDATHPYWKFTNTYRFDAGTATGNIAEVGVGRTSTTLSSHALILDGGGVPTTITVLSDEYLDVTFEWRNYIDPTSYAAIATISGTPYDITYKPTDIDTAPSIYYPTEETANGTQLMRLRETQTLGTVYTAPSGTPSTDLTLAVANYIAGNYYNDYTGEWGLSSANFATGVGSLEFLSHQGKYQISFDPKIPKDSTKVLSLTVRISWSRYP